MLENSSRTELSQLGEFGLIEQIKSSVELQHTSSLKGIGDDAAVIEYENKVTIHDATENYYDGGIYGCRNCNNIKFPLYVLKILKLYLCYLPMLVDYCSHKLFAHKIPMHRKWVRLKCASHMLHDALFMFQFLSFM